MKTILIALSFAMLLPAQFDNRRAPGFSLPEVMTQKQFDLMDFSGKPLVIEFLRTDCPKCKTLTSALEQGSEAKVRERARAVEVEHAAHGGGRLRDALQLPE